MTKTIASQITRAKHSESPDCISTITLRAFPLNEWSNISLDTSQDADRSATSVPVWRQREVLGLLLFVDSTFWILRSMLSGRLKRNLKRCRTLSALRVESALSFRPKTSWKRVSAVSLAPTRGTGERKSEWEKEKLRYYENKCWYHISLLMSVSGFLPALYAIWHSRGRAAKEKVTAIS